MTTQTTTARGAALKLLADGVATMAEVANLAGTDRQLVAYWASRAGIDAVTTREQYLQRAWNREHRARTAPPKSAIPKRKR